MRRFVGILVALGMLVTIVAFVRQTNAGIETVTFRGLFGDLIELDRRQLAIGLSLGLTLVGGWLAGELLVPLGLPRITGYLAFGIALGPSVAGLFGPGVEPLIPASHRGPLGAVDALAISLIALMAGGELQVRTVRRAMRAALGTIVGEVMIVLVPLALVIGLLGDRIGPLAGLAPAELWVVATLIGLLAVGNSPAIVIAVLKDTQARGPMRDAVLTTTIAKDLLQIVAAVVTALVTIRLALMWAAVTGAMRWAGVPDRAARWAWTGFIAQAGVSLALAREFEASFRGFPFTATVATMLVAMIAIHEIIGPPLFASGLRRAGEVPGRAP